MRIETNAANRKDVVKAVSGILEQPAKYMGVPTCNYQIGNCTIDKSGAVETEDEKTAELVTAGLTEQGLIGEPQPEMNKTTVSIPMKDMTAEGLKNLIFLIRSKQYLIGRAFAEDVFRIPTALVETLGSTEIHDAETFMQTFQSHEGDCRGISFQDGMITFTLPAISDPDMIKAFTHLAAAMVHGEKILSILKSIISEGKVQFMESLTISAPYMVRVTIPDLNIRRGPGKSYPKTGKFTGVGIFTVVEESDGWGLLKAYAEKRDGWISLVFTTRM